MAKFVALEPTDVRFPTSRELDGSDAMNPEPDYSAAYVVITTDADDGLAGHGFTFTTGRGNDIQVAALAALRPWLIGRDVDEVLANLGGFGRELTSDAQLRWLGFAGVRRGSGWKGDAVHRGVGEAWKIEGGDDVARQGKPERLRKRRFERR